MELVNLTPLVILHAVLTGCVCSSTHESAFGEFRSGELRAGAGINIWAANVTSPGATWQAVADDVMYHETDFAIVTEAKATEREQSWMTTAFQARGFTTAWAPPVELQGHRGRSGEC